MKNEYVLNWCPHCNHVVTIDKYGFGQCSRCHHYFMVNLKHKQKRINEGVE